jgi:superfamily I DNA and/or RNA helicase
MIDQLGGIVSQLFYQGRVKTCASANDLRGIRSEDSGLFWLHCSTSDQRDSDTSRLNEGEADIAVHLAHHYREQYPTKRIYVLAFYRAQMALLKQSLFVDDTPGRELEYKEDTVNFVGTADSAQGDEADIVILSLTRSAPNKFLCDMNRLCVSCKLASRSRLLMHSFSCTLSVGACW